MQRKKVFSIITIICFASIIFIPIGLVLMFYFTDWPKKKKIILCTIMTLLYITPVVVIYAINSSSDGGSQVTVTADSGSSSITGSKDNGKLVESTEKLPKTIAKQNRVKVKRWVFPVFFFLLMLFLIILQNIKSSKTDGYHNPYVNTKKYKLPITDDFEFPTVFFAKLNLLPSEKILYATETNQKDNEGNFVITNKRVVIYNKEATVSYNLNELTIASSISDTVMYLASGVEKNYIFMPENQMKYALGVIRYAFNRFSGKTTK